MSESAGDAPMAELRTIAVSLWREQNQARFRMLEIFAELNQRGVGSLGIRGLTDLIQIDLNCTRSYARSVVRDMERYASRLSMTGEQLEPRYPMVASALRDGVFSFAHADVIATAIEELPSEVRAVHGVEVEVKLVEQAVDLDPISLRTLARHLVALLDPDGPEPDEKIHYRRRGMRLTTNADGTGRIDGYLTAPANAVWQVIFANGAALRNVSLDKDGNLIDGPDQLGPDRRNLLQRQHDAFEEAGRLLLETGKLPDHAGLKADLLVAIDLRDLETRTGRATTHHGGRLSVQQVLHLAADMNVIPAVLDQDLGLVGHGRGRRLASPIQRKVIFARDRGCTFPGCDKTAAQSEVHHMLDWRTLGETNLDNLAIACGYHNNEAPRQGWKALLIKGVPHWRPPAWRDPEQRPRRNYLHHPELLTSAPPQAATPRASAPQPTRAGP